MGHPIHRTFCILNAAGKVLTWKVIKTLSSERVLIALQTGLQNQ